MPLYDSGHIQCLFLQTVETGLQDESVRAISIIRKGP